MATILLVEDEGMILILIESVLQHAGYETLTAASLAQAQAIIHSEQKIDLVFTDINLGNDLEGGLQVGQFIRQFRDGTPVVYTSGQGLTDGMKSMFVDKSRFLPKPYTDEQVIEIVSEMLRAQ
jgi:DNA-binding NtrC family response regulator